MEYVSMQMLIRYALKQCINNYQIHSWPIIAVLMTFEAKISIILISNWGCPILHAFKINKQFVVFFSNNHHFFSGLHGHRSII